MHYSILLRQVAPHVLETPESDVYTPEHACLAPRLLASRADTLAPRRRADRGCQGARGLHQVNRASCSSEALKCEKVPVHAASAYKSSSGHYCVVFGCQNKQRNKRILALSATITTRHGNSAGAVFSASPRVDNCDSSKKTRSRVKMRE